MSEIAENLRKPVGAFQGVMRDFPDGHSEGPFHPDMLDAADHIDSLEAEVVRLTAALAERENAQVIDTKLLKEAHAVMRACGWNLAPSSDNISTDGVLECAAAEIEEKFRAALGDGNG